jgi:hypothetical protein
MAVPDVLAHACVPAAATVLRLSGSLDIWRDVSKAAAVRFTHFYEHKGSLNRKLAQVK